MAATPSTMLPLGSPLPAFSLTDGLGGDGWSPHQVLGRPVLVMFICNHCPFVKHIRSAMVVVAHEAIAKGIAVVAINSNSTQSHPQDGPVHMRALALQERWHFPFLFDESQSVAKQFHAACTPEFYLFNSQHDLVYRGQFDDARPSSATAVTGRDLRAAIEALLRGLPPLTDQRPSVGCNIKWNPGSEPDYFTKPAPR